MREKSEELRAALEEWQTHAEADASPGALPRPRLTTGFLDGTHPIVDVYELKVRSERAAFSHTLAGCVIARASRGPISHSTIWQGWYCFSAVWHS